MTVDAQPIIKKLNHLLGAETRLLASNHLDEPTSDVFSQSIFLWGCAGTTSLQDLPDLNPAVIKT